MDSGRRRWGRFGMVYLVLVHLVLAYTIVERFIGRSSEWQPVPTILSPGASEAQRTPEPEDTPCPASRVEPVPEHTAFVSSSPGENSSIIVPVSGVTADRLADTFTAARSGGRSHDAIDIIAPQGTPVLAAVDGEIIKFFDSVPGGITIYQLSEDKRYIYYYAHLQRRADGLQPGGIVKQGTTIGYVGDTGNAGPGNYHLHSTHDRPETLLGRYLP